MTKEGYQPIKPKKTTKIIPPNTSSNVQKKDGYIWEDVDKAWWEGFDTCKKKAGEANVKLNDELEKLKKQLEELPDKWCRNKDDYCPHLAKLEKENEKLKKEVEKHKWNNIFLEDCADYDKKIAEEYTTLQERIEELEAQIEKMKCCGNCKNFNNFQEHCELDAIHSVECHCNNYKLWEIK